MGKFSAWPLLWLFSLLALRVLSQDLDLEDALELPTKAPAPKPKPPAGAGEKDLLTAKPPERLTTTTKAPAKPKKNPDLSQSDYFAPTIRPGLLPRTTIKAPRSTPPPPKHQSGDLNLEDAMDPSNDIKVDGKKNKGDGQLSDRDLEDLDGYSPEKGKGGREDADNNYDTLAETGTIAGIASAVGMALIGAVTSYISYQKKKLCFSIQQSLNAEMMKEENPEVVVSQEPQVQATLLQHPNAETPQD
ncbi:CD99 antigen-like protein 2 isoform X2 [Brienomyrus brachyistius]|uniref:CD99 antigen-like protein 2 isoform X2 n=1 Tax=Brienomyrus brachyistius TaxID=42636 RepID=UPI0020B1A3B2|nr:CD99 antigen-like protein 2 isoform X2 [Brienomyrus brachyistius]